MKTVTINISDRVAFELIEATGSSSIEEAVMTALNARLHLLGHDVTPEAALTAPISPSPEERSAAAVSAVAGIGDALGRISG